MGSYLSTQWYARTAGPPVRSKGHEKPIGPSPRLHEYQSIFARNLTTCFVMEADIAPTTNPFSEFVPMLHLVTTCPAIAEYCLLGRHAELSNEKTSLDLEHGGPEYHEICLRLRRCGAVEVKPLSGFREADCDGTSTEFYQQMRYVFGWPDVLPRDQHTAHPVIVFRIPSTNCVVDTSGFGMEWQRGLGWLTGCTNMTEYCQRLQDYSGVYYDNARLCPEVQELGLASKELTTYFACETRSRPVSTQDNGES